MNTPTDRATLPTFAYVLNARTGMRQFEFCDERGNPYNPPRVSGPLPVVAQANVAKVLAEALRDVKAALHSCCLVITDDEARAMALQIVKQARVALAAAGLE